MVGLRNAYVFPGCSHFVDERMCGHGACTYFMEAVMYGCYEVRVVSFVGTMTTWRITAHSHWEAEDLVLALLEEDSTIFSSELLP